MANPGGGIERSRGSREEFVPSSAWTEDSDGHYLLVDLPDFRKEEVKLQVDNDGQIIVTGERLVSNNKYIYFDQKYKIPEESDLDKIGAKFDGEILYVTVPKLAVEKAQEAGGVRAEDDVQENPSRNDNSDGNTETVADSHQLAGKKGKMGAYADGVHRVILNKWGRQESPRDLAVKMVKNNKGILVTAVIAFSIGVLVRL